MSEQLDVIDAPGGIVEPHSPKQPDMIESSGGIVEQHSPKGPLIAVIYREHHGGEWVLPKGKRQKGEPWEQTALREVEDKTGLRTVVARLAGATTYGAQGVPKLVLYWLMNTKGEIPPFKPKENGEVKHLLWLAPADAIERLTHTEETELIRKIFLIRNDRILLTRNETKTRVRFFALLPKQWTIILRRRAWQRLTSTLAAYELELKGRAANDASLAAGLMRIREILASARAGAEDGDLEQGWKCFLVAQRVELLYLVGTEVKAAAVAIHKEAEKLNPWRKAAVLATLGDPVRNDVSSKDVFRAALVRDEHFNNEAYKDGLRRGSALRLALLMIAVLMALLGLGYNGYLAEVLSIPSASASSAGANLGHVLLSVGTVGLLGAIVSAITDMQKENSSARIPEMASSFRVMILRLFMGPASAIVLYFAIRSSISKSIINLDQVDGYVILVVAFVAGFSERLVLRVVERIVK